jgi:hypothetical protein
MQMVMDDFLDATNINLYCLCHFKDRNSSIGKNKVVYQVNVGC